MPPQPPKIAKTNTEIPPNNTEHKQNQKMLFLYVKSEA